MICNIIRKNQTGLTIIVGVGLVPTLILHVFRATARVAPTPESLNLDIQINNRKLYIETSRN